MRAIWKGNISFALVSIPISLFSATRRNELSFHYLHKKDMSPVSYKRFCDTENVEVPWEEITKGYEYEKDQYVEITDEDLDKADVELARPSRSWNSSGRRDRSSVLRQAVLSNPRRAANAPMA